jgi:hypothetical protein
MTKMIISSVVVSIARRPFFLSLVETQCAPLWISSLRFEQGGVGFGGALFHFPPSSSGSFAMLLAIRLASSCVCPFQKCTLSSDTRRPVDPTHILPLATVPIALNKNGSGDEDENKDEKPH